MQGLVGYMRLRFKFTIVFLFFIWAMGDREQKIGAVIKHQFDIEILLKMREIKTIEEEISKGTVLLECLKRLLEEKDGKF
jgi:hypothetical protein